MPSSMWSKTPQEAYESPYDYNSQQQFLGEAETFLDELFKSYDCYVMKFHAEDRSVKKAIWMLQMDVLDTLRDSVYLLRLKKHRLVARLFRDALETMDLAAYFRHRSNESNKDLELWYQDEIIPNRKYRDFLRKYVDEEEARYKTEYYSSLSRITHRSYRTLLQSYSLGSEDFLAYDSHCKGDILVLPQTIAQYMSVLAGIIKIFAAEAWKRGLLNEGEVEEAWKIAFGGTQFESR